jgi:putative ABC transport system permease protein
MNSFQIAYRSILERGLASSLTMFSMALGVGLVVAVLSIHGVVAASFRNNSSLGYNMIVGAKGGREQLTLNTVFHLSKPVENVPYHYYMEFLRQDQRRAELKNSLLLRGSDLREETALLGAVAGSGSNLLAALAVQSAVDALEKKREVEFDRPGKYSAFCQNAAGREVPPQERGFAIPLCLGDYLDRFRVVGTTPQMFDDFYYTVDSDGNNARKYEFAQGRNFVHKSKEHGYFEAVLGGRVARELQLKVGDQISPSHGAPDGHTHQRKFTVVGILAMSGTPNDRAVFVNMEGFYLMEDHAKPLSEEAIGGGGNVDEAAAGESAPTAIDDPAPLPMEQREITALLVRTTSPLYAQGLQTAINEGQYAQAVFPVQVIYHLFDFMIRPVQQVLLLLTVMICIVSGVSILVSIYNSMSERRNEIAVMRALGASRSHILWIVLLEAILLAVGGGLIGFFGGHAVIVAIGPYVEHQTGVQLAVFNWDPTIAELLALFSSEFDPALASAALKLPAELVLLPFLLLLATLVGLWPAISAYQTDVSKSLGK